MGKEEKENKFSDGYEVIYQDCFCGLTHSIAVPKYGRAAPDKIWERIAHCPHAIEKNYEEIQGR